MRLQDSPDEQGLETRNAEMDSLDWEVMLDTDDVYFYETRTIALGIRQRPADVSEREWRFISRTRQRTSRELDDRMRKDTHLAYKRRDQLEFQRRKALRYSNH